MRAEAGTIRAYFVALALLLVGFGGFYAVVRQLNIHLLKERVELRRPLDSVPTRLGRWQRVGNDTVYSDTLIEELGTRSYLDRNYAIAGDPSKGMVFVHVAYYTGTIDAVPHIPERCWAVGGLEVTRNSTVVPLQIDRTGWAPLEGDDSGRYSVAFVTDAVTADREPVTMPVGEIAATTIEFQDPKRPEIRQVGGYFFIANGRATSNSYGVRSLAFNLSDRYAYYCKIQLMKRGTVASADGSLMGPFTEDASELLTMLLPHVMRCLPDWPEWERRSRGGEGAATAG
ncbi:MAG: exosortase-associated EpsI family protein [Phycisphaerales bacterium]